MTETHRLLDIRDGGEIRAALRSAGLEAPHAFIRKLDAQYDLDIHIDGLLKSLAEIDDFRTAHGAGADERWVFMERLPWDSAFFGYGIARLNEVISPQGPLHIRDDSAPCTKAIQSALNLARQAGIRYVFCTASPAYLATIRALCAAGFTLIETRCHYHKALAAPVERFNTRLAIAADVPSLATAAREMANIYDRFHADPFIDPADADRLMERWVHASINDGFADLTVVPDTEAPEAFCTAKLHQQHWHGWGLKLAQPVLSAVSVKHRGWYVKIISELEEQLRIRGAEHSFLITQITNNAVIRSWEKLGYQFGRGEHVFRVIL